MISNLTNPAKLKINFSINTVNYSISRITENDISKSSSKFLDKQLNVIDNKPAWLPDFVDLEKIRTQLKVNNGVSVTVIASDSDADKLVSQLKNQVKFAKDHGMNLSIIYINHFIPTRTLCRDIAINLSQDHQGTILVMGQNSEAIETTQYPRSIVESSEINLPLNDPSAASSIFINRVISPHYSWNIFVGGFEAVIICAIGIVALKRRKTFFE